MASSTSFGQLQVDDLFLKSDLAKQLFRATGALPIVDYHSHLPADVIASNAPFVDLADVWIRGDHYKWRAMRLNGVSERLCSGDGSGREKFAAWARTLPSAVRNPLYHWSLLELKRYFGIDEPLSTQNAEAIWNEVNSLLASPGYRPRDLLLKMKVEVLCTTDDPADSLEHHRLLRDDRFPVRVLPTFRPDLALAIDDPERFHTWLDRLAECTNTDLDRFAAFHAALRSRHDEFARMGCRFSDHGLERCYVAGASVSDMERIFQAVLQRRPVAESDIETWRAFLMLEFGRWNREKGWTMLLHLGARRNNNMRILRSVGRDAGCDSIGDFEHARTLNAFLGTLDDEGNLPRTVLFNSNPRDNLLFATIAGNFFEDGIVGKVQYGPAWWFLDTADGIRDQINALSQVGLLSTFIGMVTDSRSFLSFVRHEYFRRVVCDMIADDVYRGLVPGPAHALEKMLEGVFYRNARNYVVSQP
jgi:glucuronate isomerase